MQPKIIENFINEETAKHLNDYLKNKSDISKNGLANIFINESLSDYDENHVMNTMDKNKDFLIYDLLNLIFKSVEKEFNLSDLILERSNYLVFKKGDSKDYHLDQYGEGDLYTAILYLNDDYKGGEIIFYDGEWETRELPTTYYPKPGMLVYFKGDHTYPHEVTEITDGIRSNMTMNFRSI